jgi:hypothetical protein
MPYELIKDNVCLMTVTDPHNWFWEEFWEGCGIYHPTKKIEK